MRLFIRICAICIILLICNYLNQVFAQTFSLANIPQHAASYTISANCNVAIYNIGGGTQQWQGSSIATNGLDGTSGSTAQGCASQTGLRLEMSGAGNGSGTGDWDNKIDVIITFPNSVKGPVTFNIYDFTEPLYNDGTYNYAYYQDKTTISASKCDGTAITPTLTTNNGPITSTTMGSSLVLAAYQNQGQCKNEPISIGTSTDLIKTITISYSNQDPPNNFPSPHNPPKYGISQYQFIFISNINASPPDAIVVSANPNPVCQGQSTTLTASSSYGYSYSWSSGTTPTTGTPVTASPVTATTYTVTATLGTCTQTNAVTVNVNTPVTPTFAAIPAICSGATAPVLPTSSTNVPSITGTWSPAVSNTTSGTYTFTPTAGQCATTTTLNVTVNPNVTPNFATIPAFCYGSVAPVLGNTSPNGITGSWNPATVSNTTSASYTFTPTTGLCATTQTLNVTVTPQTVPNFAAIPAFCYGSTAPVLVTTSPNGITGSWNPSSVSNTASASYTFTPTAGLCATTQTLNITVTPQTIPNFSAIPAFCYGSVAPVLGTTSPNGITGSWNPSSVSNTASASYTFTPTAGLCATTQTLNVTVTPQTIPNFAAIPAFCYGSVAPVLATTSPNGITGSWSPATVSNTTSASYTFTPTTGLCATTQTLNVTVTPQIVPNFAAIPAFCYGSVAPVLGNTSPNGITGSWSPATVSNTTSGTYIFTPTTGLCATTQTLTDTITPQTVPNFATVPAFCYGSVAPVLGNTSPNGITGSWSPATVSNTTSASYTFTPTTGLCATTQTLNVTVTPQTVPDFAAIPSFCYGSAAPSLGNTSPNGIVGTWNPAFISNIINGTYLFTPNANQCATTQALTDTIIPQTIPNFVAIPAFCSGALAPVLGTTSPNGITGTWSPATINNTTNDTYTFTPTAGQCATTANLNVTVIPNVLPTFTAIPAFCSGALVPALPDSSTNVPSITGTWNPTLVSNTMSNTYTFTPTAGQCATTTTMDVTVIPNVTPTFNAIPAFCNGATAPFLPDSSTNIPSITGTWNPALVSNTTSDTYTFTPTAGQCATTTTMVVTVIPNVTPTFNAIPSFCNGAIAPLLPDSSTNVPSITGTWSPALVSNTTSGTYTFTPTAGQCATTATLDATVIPNVTPIFTAVPAFCSGATAPVLPTSSTNVPPITGTWNPSTVSNTTSGTYTFTPTTGQCATTATLDITVTLNITPIFTAIPAFCSGATAPVLPTSSTNVPPITGTWNPVPVNDTTSGIYTFTPTTGQCATTATLDVTVIPNVTPTFTAVPAFCSGATAPVLPDSSTNVPTINGSWSPAAVSNTLSGIYTFTPTAGQCATTATLSITVNTNPTVSAGQDTSYCKGDSVQLNATGGVTYQWSPSSGLSNSNISNPVVDTISSVNYTVTVTDINGCSNTDNIFVTVHLLPTVSASADTTFCSGGSAQLNATGGISYAWSPSAGLSSVNISNPIATPVVSTTYIVDATDANGCSAKDSVAITVNPLPVVSFSGLNNIYCVSASNDTLTGVPAGGNFYGSGINGSIFTPSTAGIGGPYTVTYVYSDINGCTDSTSQNVTITSKPVVYLTSTPPNGNAYIGQLITFNADPINYPGYLFFVDSNQVQYGTQYIYQNWTLQDGQVVYVVVNENGCVAKDSIILEIYPIPNAFTPDGNGQNDVFLKGLDITIINRWGQVLYEGTDGWDGKYNDKIVSQGTYFYLIRMKDEFNNYKKLNGVVTLLRR